MRHRPQHEVVRPLAKMCAVPTSGCLAKPIWMIRIIVMLCYLPDQIRTVGMGDGWMDEGMKDGCTLGDRWKDGCMWDKWLNMGT